MAGLLTRLFTYRPRPGRSPLEDFTTEAWVDLLNRIPPSQQLNFCTRVLMKNMGDDLRQRWRDWVGACGSDEFSWQTQFGIQIDRNGKESTKRPDIILFCGGKPVLIVENKIGAGFTYHEQDGEGDETKYENQLQTYGKWLARKTKEQGALVLLTAWTAAPLDFEDIGEKYGVTARSVVRWSEIHKQLAGDSLAYWRGSEPDAGILIDEFTNFLEEQGMALHDPTNTDAKIAVAFFGEPYKRFYNAIAYVGTRLIPLLKEGGGTRPVGPNMHHSGLWLEQYMNFKESPWIGWGIRSEKFESEGPGNEASPNKLYAYLYLSTNKDCWDIALHPDKYSYWSRLKSGQSEYSILIREVAISELMEKKTGFAEAFWEWVDHKDENDSSVLDEAIQIRNIISDHFHLQ